MNRSPYSYTKHSRDAGSRPADVRGGKPSGVSHEEQTAMRASPNTRSTPTLEWHDTPQLWVAYRGCGCVECPKGFGKTKEEAIADLENDD